ncbi:restriction endonuclease [Pelagibius sp.]|uniref:restriction endonuclease n=1 Tax=Pelagibius sp. TaxID=1931238 RepID=UPI0026056963|nr:restriction endonuclease [Pelagibius sp.]
MVERITFQSSNLQNIQAGELRAKFSAAGDRILRYYVDFRHTELDLHKELSAPEFSILQNKVDTLMAQWDKKYAAYVKKQDAVTGKEQAEELTADAELRRERLRTTLHHTLSVDDAVDWSVLKDHSKFDRKRYPRQQKKERVDSSAPPPVHVGFFQALFGQRRKIERRYQEALDKHNAEVNRVEKKNADVHAEWIKNRDAWNAEQDAQEQVFLDKQVVENAKVDALEAAWRDGQPEAVEEHASIVLEASKHDEVVPKQWEVQYDPESKLLLVEYLLPTPDDLPTTKSVRFVASTGELKETSISERDKKTLFDDLCYQICLRTLHELFEADSFDNLESIAFNGWTESIDRATGQQVTSTILSVMVQKDEFLAINLEQVEPKACFKSLKGVSAASLVGLTPIAPIIEFQKTDKRFVDARAVEIAASGTTNLAAMDWEEFEHLVRELFEKEFASRGGEVRITQSSNDGGVDAVAFDPDPISGGKIVIQAKRYTRTVGVAAVRDLYGTTMNEGAIKGILVTTADYGPDAHKFASDKPLTLMTGSHLLHLLEKHGVKARIDLREARTEMGLRP